MSSSSDKKRKNFKENDDKRDFGLRTPKNIERHDNIKYGEDEKWQILDVYRPKNVEGYLPVIVSVHGGGWVYGDKEVYQYYCMNLAERGFAVINFTYRLAPEHKFPAPIEDTHKVFNWILNNSEEYKLDVQNIFAVGDSAGAHILTMFVESVLNDDLKNILCEYGMNVFTQVYTKYFYAKQPITPKGKYLMLKGVALNCGIYKVDENEELIKDYMPESGTKEELELLDVTKYMTDDFPEVYMMTCPGDFLFMQPFYMAEVLTKKDVRFKSTIYGNKENKLTHVFHCDIRSPYAEKCNDDECKFFKSLI